MLFKEIIIDYSENGKEPIIHTVGKCRITDFIEGGMCNYHWPLKGKDGE
jgi:hypothetical protein